MEKSNERFMDNFLMCGELETVQRLYAALNAIF
jgi:hypothetical protein